MGHLNSSIRPEPRTKTFGIEGSGAVRLYEHEIELVSTAEFQRLDGIRQLGTAHLVFRSANHTRFEHSLGTLHEAQGLIDAVNRNPRRTRQIDETGTRITRLTALLHDLNHVPYSHTLEDEAHLLERHDANVLRRKRLLVESPIGEILRKALAGRTLGDSNEYELLLRCLEATDENAHELLGEYAYIADIVNNTVCADALDYIPRDLRNCGMPVAIGDHFKGYFVITPPSTSEKSDSHRMALRLDKRGMPRPDVESEVMQLLNHRYHLVERVFFHHSKNSASAMLSRAAQILGLHDTEENFLNLRDATLDLALAEPAVADALELHLTNDPDRWREASGLGRALLDRRLYKLAYLGVAEDDVNDRAEAIHRDWGRDPERRLALEDELAALAGLPRGSVLVHVPSPRMLAKRGNVRIQLDNNDIMMLSDWDRRRSGRLAALERAHERLWRVAVYVSPEVSADTVQLVNAGARDRFKLSSRYVKTPDGTSYLAEVFDLFAEERDWPIGLRAAAVAEAETMVASAQGAADGSNSLDAQVDLIDAAVRHHQEKERRNEGQEELNLDVDR
jgi:HD superfamily phosphohydrolase